MKRDREATLAVLLVFAVSQLVYWHTLAPTLTPDDSGELVAAAATLGVPHPPGYPLFTLVAHGFTLLPFDNAVRAVASMSAVLASLTAVVVFLVARELGVDAIEGVVASLLFAFGRISWSQAVVAKGTYALNTLLLAVTVLALIRATSRPDPRQFLLAAGAWGLSLGNHYMLTLIVSPALALYAGWSVYRMRRAGRTPLPYLAAGAVIVVAMLSVYLYLPWAASRNPPLSWGEPRDWPRFWDHVTRRSYRDLELATTVTLGTKLLFLGQALVLFLREWPFWVSMPLVVIGSLARTGATAERLLLAAIAVCNVAVLDAVLHFTFEAENQYRVKAYYRSAEFAVAILMALGLHRLLHGRRLFARSVVGGVLVGATLTGNFAANDLRGFTLVEEYNRTILESLEPDAVYFTGADFNGFPCIYLQAVEGLRPDVLLADITGTPSPQVLSYLREIAPAREITTVPEAQVALLASGLRPVYVTSKADLVDMEGATPVPWGWVFRMETTTSPTPIRRPTLSADQLRLPSRALLEDAMTRGLLADAYSLDAENAYHDGDLGESTRLFARAASYMFDCKEGLNDIASTAAEKGFDELAEDLFRRSAALYPGYPAARGNLAKLLRSQGRGKDALAVLEEAALGAGPDEGLAKAIAGQRAEVEARSPLSGLARYQDELRNDPESAPLWNNVGSAHAELHQTAEALQAFQRAISIDPAYAIAYRNIALLELERGDLEAHRRYMALYQQLTGPRSATPLVPEAGVPAAPAGGREGSRP